MFNGDEFKKGKIAVWCKTEEIAKNFLEECDKHDIKWNSKRIASSDTYWNYEKYNTCYFYKYGCSTGLSWGSKEFAESEHYTIIDWNGAMKSNGLSTYREVLTNIKEGEVYICEDKNCQISRIELEEEQLKETINFKGSYYIFIDKPMFRLKEEIDWNKVPQGTIILVRDSKTLEWVEREFIAYARYSQLPFITYNLRKVCTTNWEYAKLKDNNY